MNAHQTEHTRRWCRGRDGERKNAARLEWERIKAEAGKQSRRRRRSERRSEAQAQPPEVA